MPPLPSKTPFENKTTRSQKFYIMFKSELVLKLFTYIVLIYPLIPLYGLQMKTIQIYGQNYYNKHK
jgi:hypothetical protein